MRRPNFSGLLTLITAARACDKTLTPFFTTKDTEDTKKDIPQCSPCFRKDGKLDGLCIALCRLYQLLLELVNVIHPLNEFHLLVPAFVDEAYALVIQVVEMEPANGPAME